MDEKAIATKNTTTLLKEGVLRYFHAQSELYAERYLIPASGDVLGERHRAILQMVKEWHLPTKCRIADLGCGPGFLSFDLSREGYDGVGVDGAPAMILRCQREAAVGDISPLWQYQVGDVEALPLATASFDAAICAGVIEYLPSDEGLLREAVRVLKPGGRFLLCVTNKYGYTVSLYPILHWIKQAPMAVRAVSALRRIVVGGNGAMCFAFLPRKHRPSAIRQALIEHGFRIEKDKFVNFTLLPAPFCSFFSRLKLTIDEKLGFLDGTPLRFLGSCYIVSCIRSEH
jgi:SAM-dependent methyltransferase